ncbi:amino acid adenylation domain-containing protein [Streptomyces sp. NBC_00053]|uniref:non-ribosomal peptide synthetase n=1 Tax=unclassified Streptomyces TaxID=2593676 RepID=UPI00224F4FB7|nr:MULTISPECIES: non-ribosomal peptide synthetase [unclassified Streptomyces]MCX5505106.1 amino acid adenylation domain-containing protein [Streptomyces sp. NBC_00052]MCX5546357.1 amino acid adenylation domain-containing protein [Streptomyces sp. NBC_00051]
MGENSVETRLLSRMRRRAESARIVRADREAGPLPLSFAQQRLWFLDRLTPDSAEYLVPTVLRVRGALDVPALGTALSGLVARHEVLRTAFPADDNGTPRQAISAPWPVEVTVHDLRTETDAETRAGEVLRTEATRPFDLEAGRLLRADVVRLADDDHFLLLTVHHIASDGWSSGILARELRDLYAAAVAGREATLPELLIQYADFAAWQREQLSGDLLERQLAYWRERLARVTPLELPTDHQRPAQPSSGGDVVTFSVPSEVTQALRATASGQGASLFMALLSLFQIVLARYCRQDDIAVGTPVAGRNRAETEDLIGFFVNTLVLRTDLSGDPAFTELLDRVKDTALGAYDHQDLPFERLVEELAPDRDPSRNPLFQTMFVLQAPGSTEAQAWELAGTRTEPVEIERGVAKFDLTLTAVESADGLRAVLEYRTDLFERATIERLAGHFATLAASVAAAPGARLSELNMLTVGERREVLVEWNGVTGPYPDTATIHRLVEERVAASPDAVAVAHGDRRWTFGEINARANRLAHHLRGMGVTADTLIAVCLDRSPELIATLLGILKAGAAFVPLDPDYPTDRITYMVEDANAPLVITSTGLTDRIPEGFPRLLVDTQWPGGPDSDPEPLASPDDLAYVIYTSGSTGRPKGVALEHRGVVNYLHWCDQNYPVHVPGGIGSVLYSSVTFDLTITALFLPLIQGQQLAIPVTAPDQTAFDAALDLICTDIPIGFLKATPSHLEVLAAHLETRGARHHITTIVAGGENLAPQLVARLLDASSTQTTFSNEYGATEGSVANVMSLTTAPDPHGGTTTLGRPITNTTAYVVDHHNQPAPVGIPGHALLGGICLARHYHNRPDLTRQRFTTNPLAPPHPDPRTYHTGDLVKWRPDGTLEFIGRIDNQIKLRGYRIELGEIEAALNTHPHIHTTTVTTREDTPGDKRLVAYVVPIPGHAPDASGLRTHLQRQLPDYMVPSTYVTLDQLPLTPNGKVDTKALPAPDHHRPELATTYTAPRNSTEEIITGVWSDVLGIDTIGIHDNFFELGGHSLLATQVTSRLRQRLGLDVPVRALFTSPTPATLAGVVRELGTADEASLVPVDRGSGPLPLSFAQQRLWFLDQLTPGSAEYLVPFGLRVRGTLDTGALGAAFTGLVTRHEVLRTRFVTDDSGRPAQIVDAPWSVTPVVRDVRTVPTADRERAALEIMAAEARRPFELDGGRLLRVDVVRVADDDQYVLITLHHIVSDGWSSGILARELRDLYAAAVAGREASLPELLIQYADFAAWQREQLSGDFLERQLAYWRERLAGVPALELPTDHSRPAEREGAEGDTVYFSVPSEVTQALRATASGQGASLFMALLSLFQIVLARYCRQDDIAVGTPIAGRNRAETEGLIGFFVNTLVLRTDLSGDPAFTELLDRVKDTALGAYDHQDLPFERLVDELAPDRDLSRNPLFQTLFVFQNTPDGESWSLPGLTVEQVGVGGQDAKFDLQLTAAEADGELLAVLEYRTDLFERATIERLAGHFATLAASVAAAPGARLSELNMLTVGERREVLVEWNGVTGPYPDTATIHRLVEERVAASPDAVAVTHGDRRWTFGEINARANRLAHHLRGTGVTADTLIAVCLDRSPELIATLLGILKAGAAFVPLDPDYPTDRITYMVEDTGTPLIVTSSDLADRLPGGIERILVDTQWPGGPDSDPEPLAFPDDLAYVIYTSGSTGRPKGVALEHRGVVNYLHWCDQNYPVHVPGGIGSVLYSSVTFDLTITALFLPLIQGQQLAIPVTAPDQTAFDAAIDLICTDIPIGFLKATPSHLEVLAAHLETRGARHHITTIVAGGENLAPQLVARLLDASSTQTTFSNEYGATEGSVANVMSLTTAPDPHGGTTTLGRPITNTTAYVVDHHNQPAPVGIPGHALLGGICLARHYHNRPDLTRQRFTPNPLAPPHPDPRTYHTGDLVKWRPDGTLEFIGRIDNQIKLRGYRIELGEIEAALNTHPHIHTTTVTTREDTPGNKQLVAYIVATPDNTPTTHQLRTHLQRQLPDYMVPSTYVTLDQLPLTPNGKVDTKALPAPDHHRPELATTYTAPRTDTERTLAAIWSEILGIDTVGIHDNFFELGGDSIISIQMIARAKKFGVHLTPRLIFKNQTIAEIAVHAAATTPVDAEQGRVTGEVPLTPIQHWFFEKDLPTFDHFNQAELLVTDGLAPDVLRLALADLIEHHDALRLRCVDGSDGWRQYLDETVDTDILDVHDLSGVPDESLASVSLDIAEETQQSLGLAKGPLLRAALLELGPTRGQRLLTVVHHLAVDGVSWRILLEDLGSCYERRAAGLAPQLPAKTTSFRSWAQRLNGFADSAQARAEYAYWAEPKPAGRVPRDRDGRNDLGSAASVVAALSPEETRALLRDVPRVFNTRINDALLTALAHALRDWTGDDEILIGLEGHGREDLFPDVDLSRTVGWFTSVFPVALRLAPGATDPVASLKSVREQVARIPNRGVGYGILRHLGAPDVAAVLRRQPTPEVNFNYLGQFTRDLPGIGRYAGPDEPKGHSISPDGARWNVLDVTAAVEGDTFGLYINYSTALHERRTVERLADGVVDHLRELIAGSADGAADARRESPGVPLTDVGDADMAAILKRFSI